ncbi:transthyretin-like protein [Arabidopsis thaliana]|uniref:Isoform 3 of Uric acid degradation bifunctional protein TTL n=1 Tax=Arabidopsis thaliana TaxID=3702 RepID=Q9LVM5-3|nr:transthyretin-like protein [Arabidopsis thaliana]AED97019.1 transthyretin-like protein [Arabidopsis thaliana]|eukprot:NP_001032093.1 transthyretin-like protein [Arabidopsis thaliana]
MAMEIGEDEWKVCCGSSEFAKQMSTSGPLTSQEAIYTARDIWFNQVNVTDWLEAFSAHPQIGNTPSPSINSDFARRSVSEQSTAFATTSASALQELAEWNVLYKKKFGFIFIICASGRTHAEMLHALKERYENRPIVELEIAAMEQMKITELRMAKLFSDKAKVISETDSSSSPVSTKPQAAGVEVHLEVWSGTTGPSFVHGGGGVWSSVGTSATDRDGRSGPLMDLVDALNPGTYRISFDTAKYSPGCFFPYVSIVFQVTESQKWEHFHVPLLLAPFSFSTYRGS